MHPRSILSRRGFIRLAALGVAGAGGAGLYAWRIEPHWVEVVRRDLPIAHLPEVRLTALATRVPENAARVGSDVEVTGDWRALCGSERVDGVIIATPPSTHPAMLRACLAAGKPALVEKPVALGLAETLALEREVSASGVPVLVDHTLLFHPGFEALRARCPDPRAIRFVHSESRAWGPFRT